jgi:hypothetical protein
VFELNMGIFRLKFSMNFLMNLSTQLQIIGVLLVGGWAVYAERLEIGGVVASRLPASRQRSVGLDRRARRALRSACRLQSECHFPSHQSEFRKDATSSIHHRANILPTHHPKRC